MTRSRALLSWMLVSTLFCVTLVSAQSGASVKRVFAWVESLSGSEEQPLRWPIGVAAGPASEFAVLDAYGPRLIVFRRTGVPWQIVHAVELPATATSITYDRGSYIVSVRSQPATQ